MKYLEDQKKKEAEKFIESTIAAAKESSCERDKCGSIIVKNNEIIGRGHNSPPGNIESQRRCQNDKSKYHPRVTDKMCCVHAEQRALIDALKRNPDKLRGARLYFIRLDMENNPTRAGKPYCTICSKMTLDVGIKEFVLWREEGICVYETEEYNNLSYNYHE